jgi:2-oxoisovalerate dehydrogenase E2 component (dihydrolipoyl transacylase)
VIDVLVHKHSDLAETVSIVPWHVEVGDHVEERQPLVAVETDKVDTDASAPWTGIVGKITAQVGTEISVADTPCDHVG